MKKALALFSVFSLAFTLLCSVAHAVDGKPEYGNPAGSMVVPDGLNAKEIQRAIMEAGAAEDFIIKTRDDEKVVLFRDDGKWVCQLTFAYDLHEIQIYNKSARGGVPKVPDSWIKSLKKDIGRKLNNIAVTK